MGSLRAIVGPVRFDGRLAFLVPKAKEERKKEKKKEKKEKKEKKQPEAKSVANTNLKDLKVTYPYFYDEYIRWRATQSEQQPVQEVADPRRPAVARMPADDPEWVYTDSYVATSISEFFLQLVSAIFVGVTWRRFPNVPIRDHMKQSVNMMIAAPAIALLGWCFVPLWMSRNTGWANMNNSGGAIICWVCLFVGFMGFFTYGVSWLYWGRFLELPGSLWCPPDFVEQAAVWSSFSALSAAIGAIL